MSRYRGAFAGGEVTWKSGGVYGCVYHLEGLIGISAKIYFIPAGHVFMMMLIIAQIMPLVLTLMSGNFADTSGHGGLPEHSSSSKTSACR